MPSWLVLAICLVASVGLILNFSLFKLRSKVRMPEHARPFLHVFLVVNCVVSGLLAPLDAAQIGVETPSIWSPLCLATSSVAGVLCVTSALLVVSVATDRLWQLRKERHQHHHFHGYIPKFRPVNMVDSACAFFGGCLLTLPFVLHGKALYTSVLNGEDLNVTSIATFDCMLQVRGLADRYYIIQGFMQVCVLTVVGVAAVALLCYAWRHERWAEMKVKSLPDPQQTGTGRVLKEQGEAERFPCRVSSNPSDPGTITPPAAENTKHLTKMGDASTVGKLHEISSNDKSTQHDGSHTKPSASHAHDHHAHHFSVAGELFGGPGHHDGHDASGFVSHSHPKWHHFSAPPLRPHSPHDNNALSSRRHASAPPPRPNEDHAHRRHEYSLRAAALHSRGRLISSGLWRDVTPWSKRRHYDDETSVFDSDIADTSEKMIDLSTYAIHRRWSRPVATQVEHDGLLDKDTPGLRGISEDWTSGQDEETVPEDEDPQYQDSAFEADAVTNQLFPSKGKSGSSCQAFSGGCGIENPTFVSSIEDENAALDACGIGLSQGSTTVDVPKSPINSASEMSIADRSLDSSFTEEDARSSRPKETVVNVEVHGAFGDARLDCAGEDGNKQSENFPESKPFPPANGASRIEENTADNATSSLLDTKRNKLEQQSLNPDLEEFAMCEINITIPDDVSSVHTQDSAHDQGITIVARCADDVSRQGDSDAETSSTRGQKNVTLSAENAIKNPSVETSISNAFEQNTVGPGKLRGQGSKRKTSSLIRAKDFDASLRDYLQGRPKTQPTEASNLSRQNSPRKSCIKCETFHENKQLQETNERNDAKDSTGETTAVVSSSLPLQHPKERGVTVLFLAISAVLVLAYLPSVLLRLVVAMAGSDAFSSGFLGFRCLVRVHYLLPPLFPLLLRYLRKFWM